MGCSEGEFSFRVEEKSEHRKKRSLRRGLDSISPVKSGVRVHTGSVCKHLNEEENEHCIFKDIYEQPKDGGEPGEAHCEVTPGAGPHGLCATTGCFRSWKDLARNVPPRRTHMSEE